MKMIEQVKTKRCKAGKIWIIQIQSHYDTYIQMRPLSFSMYNYCYYSIYKVFSWTSAYGIKTAKWISEIHNKNKPYRAGPKSKPRRAYNTWVGPFIWVIHFPQPIMSSWTQLDYQPYASHPSIPNVRSWSSQTASKCM